MNVIINIIGTEIRLKQQVSIDPASSTLKDILRVLKVQYAGYLERFIKDDFTPVEGSVVLINGRNVWSLDRFETRIHDGDELTFTVLVAGG